jgi:hypothetical protein
MLPLMKATMEYAAVAQGAGAAPGPLFEGIVETLRKKLAEVKTVSMLEGTSMLDLVQGSCLPKDKQSLLAECITAKVSPGESVTAPKLQVHNHVEAYLTAAEWSMLQNDHYSEVDILHMLASRMLAIGLCRPSETTSKNVVSLLTASRKQASTGVQGLDLIREFKKQQKSLVAGYPASMQGPAVYPAEPATFKVLHPALYAEAYKDEAVPVPSPIPRVIILRVQYGMPCRSTKASCKGMPPQNTSGFDNTNQMQQIVAGTMHALCNMPSFPALKDRWCAQTTEGPRPVEVAPETKATKQAMGVSDPIPRVDAERKNKSPFPKIPDSWESPEACGSEGIQQPSPAATVPEKVAPKNAHELMAQMQKLADAKSKPVVQVPVPRVAKRPAAAEEGSASSPLKKPAASAKVPGKIESAEDLPEGWWAEERTRHSGTFKGQKYFLYYNPAKKQFRSLREVQDALV